MHGELPRGLQEARAGLVRYSGSNPEWAYRFRLLEAEILVRQGHNQDALNTLKVDLPPTQMQGDLATRKLIQMGIAYFRLGQGQQAEQSLAEAERLCDGTCDAFGELARARGVIEVDRGHLAEAEQLFRQSLEVARRQHDPYLEVSDLLNLGVTTVQRGHFDESIHWSQEAQRVAVQLGAGLTEEKALGNLGWAYYKLGDFEKSEALFVEAITRSKQIGSQRDEVEWLNTLGLVYYQKNRLADAEANYKQSLALAQQIHDPIEISGALSTLALVSNLKGDTGLARTYCDQALALTRSNGDHASEMFVTLIEGQIAAKQGDSALAEELFRQVAQDSSGDTSLRWESEAALSRLYEQQQHFALADKQYREAIATFEGARSSVGDEDLTLAFLANATHLYDDYIHFLITRGKIEEALQVADYSRARTLAEGLGVLKKGRVQNAAFAIAPQQVARKLHSVILFYWLGEQQSYLWAISGNQIFLYPLPPKSEIAPMVHSYTRALLGSRDVLQTSNADGAKLHELLVSPASRLITDDSRVVIIPDGELTSLNFETLLVRSPQMHYWVEDVTLANASSLRLLAAATSASPSPRGETSLLLIGDPVSAAAEYGNLPNAALEMADIQNHFPASERQVLAHEQATPPAYLASHPERYAYIHFVAHGTASVLSPLDSAVVLSPSTPEEGSFKLYARDIVHQPLHADLVTISACYGAGSRAYIGEGLVGLSWAFLRAGAHNVIGALWEVSDSSTPQLMNQLYTELGKGRPPEEALRTAKLAMLHSDGVFRKPFYWAPFQLYTGS